MWGITNQQAVHFDCGSGDTLSLKSSCLLFSSRSAQTAAPAQTQRPVPGDAGEPAGNVAYILVFPRPSGAVLMSEFFDRTSELTAGVKADVWTWFMTLGREEWLVVLAVVCACGFVALLGCRSRYL